ncbi:hypothetical protein JCM19000A_29330 [Silvimonas sp. JCM 19000]
MARIKLEPPQWVDFATELTIRVTDINYGGHLGHQELIGLMHEARVQYFAHYDQTETGRAGEPGIIMNDLAVMYRSEAFLGETLQISMAGAEPWRAGFDLYYTVNALSATAAPRLVAVAKTGIAFFDYNARKLASMPAAWAARLTRPPQD